MSKEKHIIKHEKEIEVRPKVYEPKKISAETRTFGQTASDKMTSFMGSWGFIILFVVILITWIFVNFYGWMNAWDPYPFILLNLVLSCLAAIQAPIIFMSQNRSEQKDRVRQEYDYATDRKALQQINKVYKELVYLRSDLNQLKKRRPKKQKR